MPVYEYECRNCGDRREVEQRITAEPLSECTECGKFALQRLISGSSFVLRGTGWAADNYAAKKTAPAGG